MLDKGLTRLTCRSHRLSRPRRPAPDERVQTEVLARLAAIERLLADRPRGRTG